MQVMLAIGFLIFDIINFVLHIVGFSLLFTLYQKSQRKNAQQLFMINLACSSILFVGGYIARDIVYLAGWLGFRPGQAAFSSINIVLSYLILTWQFNYTRICLTYSYTRIHYVCIHTQIDAHIVDTLCVYTLGVHGQFFVEGQRQLRLKVATVITSTRVF